MRAQSGPNSWASFMRLRVAASRMQNTLSSSHFMHWGPSLSSKNCAHAQGQGFRVCKGEGW